MKMIDKHAGPPTPKLVVPEHRASVCGLAPFAQARRLLSRFCWRPWPTKLKGATGRSLLCARFPSLLEGSAPGKGKSFLKASIQKP